MKEATEQLILTELRRLGILMEEGLGRQDAMLEAMALALEHVRHIPAMREDLAEVKQDIKTIKAAVTDTNRELHSTGRRTPRTRTHTGLT